MEDFNHAPLMCLKLNFHRSSRILPISGFKASNSKAADRSKTAYYFPTASGSARKKRRSYTQKRSITKVFINVRANL